MTKLLPNQLFLKQYQIIKKTHEGGMDSSIYSAYDKKNKRQVMIKQIVRTEKTTPAMWDRVNDECLTLLRLKNKRHIINTYDVIKMEKEVFIIMEYFPSISLRKLIDNSGLLEPLAALFIFKQIIDALKQMYSFKHKIIHKDLKPENILVDPDNLEIKLIDFGISSVIDQNQLLTNESELFGSFAYLSPILIDSFDEDKTKVIVNEKTDFYSCGIILFEMLTGYQPFNYLRKDPSQSVINIIKTYDIPSIHKLNPKVCYNFDNIIFRLTAVKPSQVSYTYNSCDEIERDIDRIYQKDYDIKLLNPKLLNYYESFFDNQKRLSRIRWYKQNWFFILLAMISLVFIIITIVIWLI